MKNKPAGAPVTIPLMDADFIAIGFDINTCNVEVKWLRRVSNEEFKQGLRIAAQITSELRRELKKTHALCAAIN